MARQQIADLVPSARVTVRETGYAAMKMEASAERGELYSCVISAYDTACTHLHKIDPSGACEFIRATYGPAFRFSQEVR